MIDDCPNPRCENGEVPGGSKGWLLCPDCKGAAKGVDVTKAEIWARAELGLPPRSYPDAITNPIDPPTVTGTDINRQI